MAERKIDPRLLDAVAMCLCWAEFAEAGIRLRPADETPASYWAAMRQDRREVYYADAEPIARFMAGDRDIALVGVCPGDDVLVELLRSIGRLGGLRLAAARWRGALRAAPRFPKREATA